MKRWMLTLTSMTLALALAAPGLAKSYAGKKVLFVDSYHEGYDWSDGVTKGVVDGLKGSGVELKVVRMDTKRKKTEEDKKAAALMVKGVIESFHPDVVIASDDNASNYLIVPYFKDASLPFVFCGVNWDASGYGFPCKNVTGMVEVSSVNELVDLLKSLAKGNRIGFLGEDTETDRKEASFYDKMLNTEIQKAFPSTFEEWKQAYLAFQDSVDLLINYNYTSLKGWNDAEAAAFVQANTKIPTGAFQEGQMNHTLLGYLKIPEEQGAWAAATALKILDGEAPSAIPVARNKDGQIMVNLKIAQALDAQIPYELLQSASKVIE